MSAYEKEFQCYKHELFQLIEKVMVRNKLNGQDDHMEEQLQIIDLHNVPPSS
jgi:hypothetical protein